MLRKDVLSILRFSPGFSKHRMEEGMVRGEERRSNSELRQMPTWWVSEHVTILPGTRKNLVRELLRVRHLLLRVRHLLYSC